VFIFSVSVLLLLLLFINAVSVGMQVVRFFSVWGCCATLGWWVSQVSCGGEGWLGGIFVWI